MPVLGHLSILSMTNSLPNLLWASSTPTYKTSMFLSWPPCCLISLMNAIVPIDGFLVSFSSLRIWSNSVFSRKPSPALCLKPPLALCYVPSCPVSLYSILAICFQYPKLSPFVYLIIIFFMVLSCLLSYPQDLKLFLTI